MITEPTANIPLSYEELHQQNLALRRELDVLRAKRRSPWPMLVETSRRLQLSSASIKAAVTSLLNYDIFWDEGNRHEFLETINTSVDEAAKLIKLLTLAFRSEEGSLELKREPQMLQEIISLVRDRGATSFPKLKLELVFPKEGRPVLVDYEYLTIALELLFEVLEARMDVHTVRVQAIESAENWFLDLDGIDFAIIRLIPKMPDYQAEDTGVAEDLSLENILRLYTAYTILHQQSIQVEVFSDSDGKPKLRLCVPALTLS